MEVSLELIRQGIHQKQDFIATLDDIFEISKQINSLCNTDGGLLWFGIKQNAKVCGVFSEAVSQHMKEISALFSAPFEYKLHKFQVEMKHIVAVSLEKTQSKPVYFLNQEEEKVTFFRVEGKIFQANKIVKHYWKLKLEKSDSTIQSPFDSEVFTQIQENSYATLSQLYRLFPNKLNKVDKSLSRLLYIQKVDFAVKDNKLCYKAKI